MSDADIIKLLGQSGIAVVALVILGKVIWKVGLRMIHALDQVAEKLDSHTKADIQAWNSVDVKLEQRMQGASMDWMKFQQEMLEQVALVRRDLAVVGTRIDTIIELDAKPHSRTDEYSHKMSIPKPVTSRKKEDER